MKVELVINLEDARLHRAIVAARNRGCDRGSCCSRGLLHCLSQHTDFIARSYAKHNRFAKAHTLEFFTKFAQGLCPTRSP
jgi:hypothetical protein